jgi:hypothetical protein
MMPKCEHANETIDKRPGDCYSGGRQTKNGNERDKYLLMSCRELRVGATQELIGEKSTRKPTCKRQRPPRYQRQNEFQHYPIQKK